MITNS